MIRFNRQAVRGDLILPAFMPLLITLFLFYIDEGKYNFVGILQPDNILFLILYGAVFFGFQQLVKIGFQFFLGAGKSQRIISGALAALCLLLSLALFFWMIKPN